MRWTPAFVGGTWILVWGFWIAGLHTPMSFAAALVGCTGIALVGGSIVDGLINTGRR